MPDRMPHTPSTTSSRHVDIGDAHTWIKLSENYFSAFRTHKFISLLTMLLLVVLFLFLSVHCTYRKVLE